MDCLIIAGSEPHRFSHHAEDTLHNWRPMWGQQKAKDYVSALNHAPALILDSGGILRHICQNIRRYPGPGRTRTTMLNPSLGATSTQTFRRGLQVGERKNLEDQEPGQVCSREKQQILMLQTAVCIISTRCFVSPFLKELYCPAYAGRTPRD